MLLVILVYGHGINFPAVVVLSRLCLLYYTGNQSYEEIERSMITGYIQDRIPTIEECEELMRKYAMLPNIVDHSFQVMRFSLALVDNLKSDVSIDRDLVISAALLHDITKTRSLTTKERHDISGGLLLRELGFPRLAPIVEQHVLFQNFFPDGKLEECDIIYYADKRVLHDKIVTIEDRAQDLIQRYGTTENIRNLILENFSLVPDVEKKIAGFMAIDIQSAIQRMDDSV